MKNLNSTTAIVQDANSSSETINGFCKLDKSYSKAPELSVSRIVASDPQDLETCNTESEYLSSLDLIDIQGYLSNVADTSTNEAQTDGPEISVSYLCKDNKKCPRQSFCYYCEKPFTNITKHILRKHFDDTTVQKAKKLPIGSKARKMNLSNIQKAGNFRHNVSVIKERKGDLIVCRRP